MNPLDGRPAQIVNLVQRFKQLAAGQIYEVLFHASASRTSCDRALRRLVEGHYLARIERRIIGGGKGGSGQFVYQLGRRGYFIYYTGRFQPSRVVNYHALAIGDCYVILKNLERAGQVRLLALSTEPDCWTDDLKPDMYIELATGASACLKLWFEIDMGTESQIRLRAKLEAYERAWSSGDPETVFPRVVWVAVDSERETEIKWLISQMDVQSRDLFRVCTRENLWITD